MTLADTILSIHKLRQCFENTQRRLAVNTPPETLAEAKTEWERHFATLDTLYDKDDANAAIILSELNDAKVKIVTSFCTKDFLTQYGAEFSYDDVDCMVEEITNLIGEVDADEQKDKLRAKFDAMSRRVETGEKFAAYLKRLNNVASQLATGAENEKTREFIVDAQFRKSLTPAEAEFILIHGKEKMTVADQAQLLDDKRQFLVSKVNAIRQNRIDELECQVAEAMEESTQLRSTIDNLRRQGEVRHAEQAAQINEMRAMMSAKKKTEEQRRMLPRRTAPYGKRQPLKMSDRCEECGLRKHNGSCYFVGNCNTCGKAGHIQFAVKHHPERKND